MVGFVQYLAGRADYTTSAADNQGPSLIKRNNHYRSDSIELDPFQIEVIRILGPSQTLFQFEDPERCFQFSYSFGAYILEQRE
jgi:hypothetical protein